jgi:pimeloyl-ACP methyl ester carboxylesterase
MISKFLITTFVCISFSCYSQKTERVIVATQDPYDLYASMGKDSTTLFYEKMIPANKPVGVIVILPGTFESIDDIKKQISLHKLAIERNFIVLFPAINFGTTKGYADRKFLDTIFEQVVSQYNVPKEKFILGGFSGGAMLALTYAEKANESADSTFLRPAAIFGVDPPLDYAHLWNHCVHDIERNVSKVAVDESKIIMEEYKREFGGSPVEFPETYTRHSIFSYGEKDGGNARYLIKTPVLLYTEPDIKWQMQNRQRDYYDLNCVDIAAMINFLQIKGNKNAELVVTNNKGKRLNGMRHPHSWSIMDSSYCMAWILKQVGMVKK